MFGTKTTYSPADSARGVFFGNFNNDSYPDMAVANQASDNISVFINDGDGTFGSPSTISSGSTTGPRGISGGDFNNDDEIDLVTANFSSGTMSYLQGNGDGTFDSAVQTNTGAGSLAVLVSDLDGDGADDLAVANFNANNASILISNNDGTFDAAVNYAAGTNPRSMNVSQLDNNNNIDFAVANGGSHDVTVYLSQGEPIAPEISSVSSDKANGTYDVGEVIDIDLTFSEAVTSTGNVTVTLETGSTDRSCTFTVSNSTTGSCNYTVQSGDTSSDLTVSTVTGTIRDADSDAMVNFVPVINLAANKNIVIDTSGPSPTPTPTPTATPTPTPTASSSSESSSTSSNNSGSQSCTDSTPVGTPDLFQIDATQTTATVYFVPLAGVTKYYISYSTNSSAEQHGVEVSLGSSGIQNYTVNLLASGTEYYFKVRGQNGCMPGAWSNTKNASTVGANNSTGFVTDTVTNTITDLLPEKKIDFIESNLISKPSNVCSYTVQQGDSLWSIADGKLEDGTRFTDIKDLNSLTSNTLSVGQMLKLPCDQEPESVEKAKDEIVQEGTKLDVLVKDNNNVPLEGVTVTLHSKVQVSKTDKDGIARFQNVEPGDHRVILAYNDYNGEQKLTVDGSQKEQVLTLQVQMNNGFSSPLVLGLFIVMAIVIILLLLILIIVLKRRKKSDIHSKT